MAAVGLAAAVGGVVLARPLLEALYGAEYAPAASAFAVLLAALLLMAFSRPYRVLLVAERQQGLDLRILLVSAVVNVAGNIVLLPRYGLLGAASATLASEALLLVLAHAAVRRLAPGIALARHLVRPTLCAAAMAALVLAIPSWPLVARIAAGAACYVTLGLALRIVDWRDLGGLAPTGEG
jgi:O-antigen/teichoic acid export membrane protein